MHQVFHNHQIIQMHQDRSCETNRRSVGVFLATLWVHFSRSVKTGAASSITMLLSPDVPFPSCGLERVPMRFPLGGGFFFLFSIASWAKSVGPDVFVALLGLFLLFVLVNEVCSQKWCVFGKILRWHDMMDFWDDGSGDEPSACVFVEIALFWYQR